MSNAERLLALGPGRIESEIEPYSPTVYDFLLRQTPELHYHSFNDYLEFPEFTPLLQSIAAFDHEVFVHSEEERSKMLMTNDLPTDHAFWRLGGEDFMKEQQELAEKKAQGERFSLISYNSEDDSWGIEAPLGGAYYNVMVGPEYYAQMKGTPRLPVVEVHSHPDNTLFSPRDYTDLLTALANGKRFYRGLIVICPDVQILALATKETPLYDPEKAFTFTENLSEEISRTETPKLKKLGERTDRISDFIDDYRDALEIEVTPDLDELERKDKEQPLENDEYIKELKAILLRHRPSLAEDHTWHMRMKHATQKKYADEVNWILNDQLISLARRLNIRLYTSDNMTDFTAFSA